MTLTLTGSGPGSGSVFTPASLSGLLAWYKADAGTSTTTDGVAISQWNDQSGNVQHLVQATGANQPLFKAAILNGQPVARFDGVNDFMRATGVTTVQPNTIFAVASSTSTGVLKKLFDGATARQLFQFEAATTVTFSAGANLTSAAGAQDTSAHVWSFVANGGTSAGYKDGTAFASGAGGANALTSLVVGIRGTDLASDAWAGDIAEFVLYSSALSTTDRQSVQNYLGAKYGITVV